jgi:murein DD-endopeptidase MepM/ murein hydrolase activator NlpD
MTVRRNFFYLTLVFLIFFLIGMGGAHGTRAAFLTQETPEPVPQEIEKAIEEAFHRTADQNQMQILGFLIHQVVIDHIEYSQDGSTALLWLALLDTETGEVIATEPGLSIATNANPSALADSNSWMIALQSTDTWEQQLLSLPEDLLTEEIRKRQLDQSSVDPQNMEIQPSAVQVLTGYRLPWTAGLSRRVTNSIGHVYSVTGGLTSCPSTCRYAFDFADGTMFPLLASKGGTVKAMKWTCPNYDTNCTNYLILEDQSTIPTSYQVYYHLAYNTIPARLRKIGEPVLRGEYIGDVDDTGYSTGHHLHYHVYTSRTQTDWSWGYSVDFVYEDVTTNGGRPRTCAEASEYPNLGSQCMPNNRYVSGNTPAYPPVATFTAPADRQVVTGRTVKVSGTASDDIQIVRIQVLANYDGTWKTIDDIPPAGNGPYSKDVDLCAAGVPDGPLALMVRVYDREGSIANGLPVRQIIKNSNCSTTTTPPSAPACTPATNEVALYAETDFRGTCSKFKVSGVGYTADQLGSVNDNNAASIQVGSSVQAVLFDRSSDVSSIVISGRSETFEGNDASLSDNLIGIDRVSGLQVLYRTDPPDEPFLSPIGSRLTAGANPSSVDSLVFSWEGGVGGTAFDVTLTGPSTNWTKTVTGTTSLSVGNLAAGSYKLAVKAKNSAGANTSDKTFTVSSATLPDATAKTVPYTENLETSSGEWIASGLWRYGKVEVGERTSTSAWIYNNNTNYSDATWRAGDLTSPPITIPASGVHYLRFFYYADVEDGERHYDQRRVQISADGGPFTDLHLLTDDRQIGQIWLNSGPISLASYAGKKIRVRFHFDTIDEDNNLTKGWMIDDISINNQGPDTSCADSDKNSPDFSQSIALGSTVTGTICPEGDVDYYQFTAKAGQPLVADINALTLSPASLLDSHVFLLDSDKRSVLHENDDEQTGVLQDSLLSYVIQRDGTYYLKVRAWNPGVGGKSHSYQLGLNTNVSIPPKLVKFVYPTTNNQAPALPFDIMVEAQDYDGGQVSQVDFYWHGSDWNVVEWVKLGTDTDGSNGWSMRVDPSLYGVVKGAAVYAQARGRMGGVLGTVIWSLQPDLSSPVTNLKALPGQTYSTAIRLEWTAADLQDDIDRFEIQYQAYNGSAWSGWQNYTQRALPGHLRAAWFTGSAGSSYRFRLRGIDRVGNVEVYPEAPEAWTALAAACTPDPAESSGQTIETALSLTRKSMSSLFNFCKSTQPGMGGGDIDWIAMDAVTGENLSFMAMSKSGGAAFAVNLYNTNKTLMGSWQSMDFQSSVSGKWIAPSTGKYYLEIKPMKPDLSGTDVLYVVWYGPSNWIYLPTINR